MLSLLIVYPVGVIAWVSVPIAVMVSANPSAPKRVTRTVSEPWPDRSPSRETRPMPRTLSCSVISCRILFPAKT